MSATVQYSVSPLSQESEHPALPTSCGSKKERDLGSCPSVWRNLAAFYVHYSGRWTHDVVSVVGLKVGI